MKTIKTVLSNTLTLVLLLTIVAGALWFFSRPAPDNQPVAQDAEGTPAPSPTPNEAQATPTPVEATVTLPPTQTPSDLLPDEQIEPTWTPAIVLPEGTSPPIPTPPPTPTATPLNPDEKMITAFDIPIHEIAISPDDKTLALVANISSSGGERTRQIWMLDLPSRQIEKLQASGRNPIWSLDGQYVVFSEKQNDQTEIKIINRNGQNEKNLMSVASEDLLDYYWQNANQVDVVRSNGIHRVDLTGRVLDRVDLVLPTQIENAQVKPKVTGHRMGVVIVSNGTNLEVIRHNGQSTIIEDKGDERRRITKFSLSPNSQQIAYVVDDGATNDELWVTNLDGTRSTQLYRVERGHIRSVSWTPNGQAMVIGWRETGTSLGVELSLLWVDIKNGQSMPLFVHGVDNSFVFSSRGGQIFYGRTFYSTPNDEGKTRLYEFEVKIK